MPDRRMMVIGLDSAAPELVFGRWKELLPNLKTLASSGAYGHLRSCIPCITVPAWSVMTAGKDPGVLGIYGFRNRTDHSYGRMTIATSAAVKEPRVWDLLGQAGRRVVTVGVPGTYPPRPVNGVQVGCFLTPATVEIDATGKRTTRTFTYPPEMSVQVNDWAGGEYLVDVKEFRTDRKDHLARQIREMTTQHFHVVRELARREPWDFFMFVEMGVDRVHHGFWRFSDPGHRLYQPGNPYENVIRDYYVQLDEEIGALLGLLDDRTAVMVVSDHGAKSMQGGLCINEWLAREGLLALAGERAGEIRPLEKVGVDWKRTQAWGEGGYYGRVFLNVQGREPQGVIPMEGYERMRGELAERLRRIRGPEGNDLGTVVHLPEQIYRVVNGVAPDLIVYFGNLDWRSVGSVGHPAIWTQENDTGPDDANHAEEGVFIYYDPRHPLGGRMLTGLEIMDVAPTVLSYFGVECPGDMQGRVIEPLVTSGGS